MPYQWGGGKILQRNTDFGFVRVVVGHPNVNVRTDLRQWIAGSDMAEIKRALRGIGEMPSTKNPGDFDARAGLVWRWVLEHVDYTSDDSSHRRGEFYQFPAETIALGKGDCEDSAFLLASLLIASGISEYCVRAVLGSIKWGDDQISEGHAWVTYKDEVGIWRLLETTMDAGDLPDIADVQTWPTADASSKRGARPWYVPDICLTQTHVWSIREIPGDDVEQFVRTYRGKENPA